jgi:hypothetical protein
VTELLSAANEEEFRLALSAIDVHVPARSEGRKKEQAERYSIAHLLASLPCEEISYPLSLTHQDRPDFVLHMANRKIGIEHIEAVPENHVRASIFRQKGIGPKVYMLQRHDPGELSSSNNTIRNDIIQDNAGAPWLGNEVEVEWTKVMQHCIDAKLEILNRSGFTKFQENWLLIYNNWPLPGVHHKEATSLLASTFQNNSTPTNFNRVFILDSKVLCEVGNLSRLHPVKSPRAGA